MNIYCIENDGFKFQELDLEIEDFANRFPDNVSTIEIYDFSKNNISLSDYWEVVQTGFSPIEGRENLIPDIAIWIGATFVLSPKAYRLLSDVLQPYGELLSFLIERETYYIFNCLTKLDLDNNKLIDGSDVSNAAIFKLETPLGMKMYCSARLREAIESFELKGIVFLDNELTKL